MPVQRQGQGPTSPFTAQGNWQFAAQIAYWNGRAWEYDAEYMLHRNYSAGAYRTSSYCRIG